MMSTTCQIINGVWSTALVTTTTTYRRTSGACKIAPKGVNLGRALGRLGQAGMLKATKTLCPSPAWLRQMWMLPMLFSLTDITLEQTSDAQYHFATVDDSTVDASATSIIAQKPRPATTFNETVVPVAALASTVLHFEETSNCGALTAYRVPPRDDGGPVGRSNRGSRSTALRN